MRTHAGCGKHPAELATTVCSTCDRGCCQRCAFPVRQRVLCIDCGLLFGGISTRQRGQRS